MKEWLTHNASDLVLWGGALAVLHRWLTTLIRSLRAWVVAQVADPLARVAEQVEGIEHRVRYHLGPNGDTTPLHVRVQVIEQVHATAGVEPDEVAGIIASRQVGGRRKTDPKEGTP